MSNIIQKGTAISCGNNVGIALSEPVTILSLRNLSSVPVDINEHWSRIYITTFYLWDASDPDIKDKFIITQRSFPKYMWDETMFTAIFGNKKSWMVTSESRVV